MPAEGMRSEVTSAPSAEDCKVIIDGMATFNKTVVDLRSVPLAVLVRDGSGSAIGGMLGHTSGGWLSIDVLWLPAHLRGGGIGAKLVASAETEARQRGCVGAHVNTGSFQAPGFYERLGFEVCGIIDDYPLNHKRITLSKRFDSVTESAK